MKMITASGGATLVLVTAANDQQANSIAHALVGERLAACVNIVSPIRSIYRWQDEVQADSEYLMLIKTRATLVSKIESRVKELHSYEVPEVIAIPIANGSKPYLEWLRASTIPAPPGARKKIHLPTKGRKK